MDINNLSPVELAKLKRIHEDPALWAKAYLVTYDAIQKKDVPWTARWYQAEMMRDKSTRKVYRCGRRTGKTEVMIVEALHKIFTKRNHRVLFVAPYENQIRLVFTRLKELVASSPLFKEHVVSITMNPFTLKLDNQSAIFGFTTGASSGSGGASIRGQRADWLYLDECDYLGDGDFDTVSMIAGERADIGMTISSTPTGKRGQFYQACTDPNMGYSEHYHPSTHNPQWCDQMEAEFRAQLTDNGYVHEVEANFGTEETGVFPKDKVDWACQQEYYAYDALTFAQRQKMSDIGIVPKMNIYSKENKPPFNPFRTMGIDWDKYGASSSILILDFDPFLRKFKVMKRVEVPKAEYSYDAAVNLIVELNDIYTPSWIYADRGSGEYQIERLHILGEEKPSTGLKNKVKGFQFKNKLEVFDPVNKTMTKEPMKPFMVNQLVLAFERQRLLMSPFDETLHKQLIDYQVERISQFGDPVYSSVNEHFVDALGLAMLAFVLEFPDITGTIQEMKFSTKIEHSNKQIGQNQAMQTLRSIEAPFERQLPGKKKKDDDLPGDKQKWFKVDTNSSSHIAKTGWGSRGGSTFRSSW